MIPSTTIIVPIVKGMEDFEILQRVISESPILAQSGIEFFLVNLGSGEALRHVIEARMAQTGAPFRQIGLPVSDEVSSAIKLGFDATLTDLVGYMDQSKPRSDMTKLFRLVETYDYVFESISDGSDEGLSHFILKTELAKKIPYCPGMKNYLSVLIQSLGGTIKNIADSQIDSASCASL